MDASRRALRDTVVGLDDDLAFQQREWRLQRVGVWLLSAMLGLALLGGLGGGGPLNHASTPAADGSVTVQYSPVLRAGAPTTVEVLVRGEAESCLISRDWFSQVGIERITPAPDAVFDEGQTLRLTFGRPLVPGTRIVVEAVPRHPGRLNGWLGLPGHARSHFDAIVLM